MRTNDFTPTLILPRQYSCSVLLSVILIAAGRYLPVKEGHAPADYEYPRLNMSMFTPLASNPRVRLGSLTNTQGMPSHRLTILPSQNSSTARPRLLL